MHISVVPSLHSAAVNRMQRAALWLLHSFRRAITSLCFAASIEKVVRMEIITIREVIALNLYLGIVTILGTSAVQIFWYVKEKDGKLRYGFKFPSV